MSDLLTALRIICSIGWGLLAVYMATGAATAAFGSRIRRGDPMRLAVFVTAIIICGFSLRHLLDPDNEALWALLYGLSAADAVFIWRLGVAYGRGPRV